MDIDELLEIYCTCETKRRGRPPRKALEKILIDISRARYSSPSVYLASFILVPLHSGIATDAREFSLRVAAEGLREIIAGCDYMDMYFEVSSLLDALAKGETDVIAIETRLRQLQKNYKKVQVERDRKYVYILDDKANGLVKIGHARTPQDRCMAVAVASKRTMTLHSWYAFGEEKCGAVNAEHRAHLHFEHANADLTGFAGATEFFKVTPDEVSEYLILIGGRRLPMPDNAEIHMNTPGTPELLAVMEELHDEDKKIKCGFYEHFISRPHSRKLEKNTFTILDRDFFAYIANTFYLVPLGSNKIEVSTQDLCGFFKIPMPMCEVERKFLLEKVIRIMSISITVLGGAWKKNLIGSISCNLQGYEFVICEGMREYFRPDLFELLGFEPESKKKSRRSRSAEHTPCHSIG